ncbi:type IV pilin [Halopenitus persicus]|uniref:type IV pilin n=1 Tax=Halopenitus persicus TaxID=1048396 RepID=UPI000BBAC445|nr:type IV pilin N-terminal domain-containing protein [Halopenitus persicus]
MNVHKLWTDDRAVSPVVGVALLIAITVILAAVIGGVVLGLGTSSADAPQASLQFEYDDGTDTITIYHNGGDPLGDNVEVRGSALDTTPQTITVSAGGSADVNTSDGTTGEIAVVWMDPNSDDESVIAKYDVE